MKKANPNSPSTRPKSSIHKPRANASKPSRSSKPNTASLSRKEIRVSIWKMMQQRCAYCGQKVEYSKMQVDHIKPLLRGVSDRQLAAQPRRALKKGLDTLENSHCSCARCNKWKSDYSLEEFRKVVAGRVKALTNSSPTFRLLLDYGFVQITQPPVVRFYFETI